MTDDARGLLAAIVAEPADDAARLAYADCIEERGNAARAEFIRAQIAAERLHPDSSARLELERRAEALFAEHWIDWWGEVCAAVGLPTPAPSPASRFGRYALVFGLGTTPGAPYATSGVAIQPASGEPIDGWRAATFRRGFPDTIHVAVPPGLTRESLLRTTLKFWMPEFPIASLTVTNFWGPLGENPFAGVRALTLLEYYDQDVLRGALQAEMFPRLEDLTLSSGEYVAEGVIVEGRANQAAGAVRLLRGRNLGRLALQVWTDAAAVAVAEAPHLASLEALEVDVLPDVSDDFEGATWRLARLVRSPHLAGLKELTVSGWPARGWPAAALSRIVCTAATWAELRKLTINADLGPADLDPHPAALLEGATLPALEELRVRGVYLNRESIDHLVRSPLLKQLRHFAFAAYDVDAVSDADLRRLPEMFDLDRIETFRFNPDHHMPGLDGLRRRLGDKLRMS